MNRASRYLLKHFGALFSSLFFILFFITSIVFFIKITALTAIIQMNFLELGTLYVYLLPRTLIYTLPVTFFIALVITLFNLSKENETIVLFTLGYNPKKIAHLFLSLSVALSLLLMVTIFVLIPISKQLNSNFIDYKKAEAKFNIKASEFGQKFSQWLVYIEKNDDQKHYSGITLYQTPTPKENERLILASHATIENEGGKLRLNLEEGKIFEFRKDEIEQINFERMHINSQPKSAIGVMQSVKEYWNGVFVDDKRAYDLSFFLLIALFPIASTLIALSIGIVTYRYNKGGIYGAIFTTIFLYFASATLFSTWHPQSAPLVVFLLSFGVAYKIYQKRIQAIF
ncbi:LptF/LptG family permease [Sulfurospirillum barnesii]|uniref:Putative permease n=1 Tax=Sulfurospirillum barnesii (strain ATCC 700032 / DSM 10660 / SES-3) TaxID=760154 RepID=I3XWV6_SULBS|nr:LptF/LptG family permease [Sulfurospirillum barnesii]AFL68430.1 putative permease [Sulfurospirillum barnesii SES-3]